MDIVTPMLTGMTSGIALIAIALYYYERKQRRRSELELNQSEFTLAGLKADQESLNRHIAAQESEVRRNQQLAEGQLREAGRAREIIDSQPQPLWVRDAALTVIDCNEAYAKAVGSLREKVIEEAIELVDSRDREKARQLAQAALDSQEAQSARFHAIVGGERCLLQVTETPASAGGTIGLAQDVSETEIAQDSLKRTLATQRSVLEQLTVGIVILGEDLRVLFYNSAYVRLRQHDEIFLNGAPLFSELLERERELRQLPEQQDFTAYRQEQERKLKTMLEPLEELQHLPDGRTLRLTAHSLPLGGYIMTLEDVSDRVTLERTYNTLLEVQRETLDKLYEAVAVFGADGRLKLYNPTYAEIWQLDSEYLDSGPHVRDLVARVRHLVEIENDEDWQKMSEQVVFNATEAQSRGGRVQRADGLVLDWAQVPLPSGESLFTYVDVTDSFRVELALRDKNEALETADRLKSEFLANMSYELRTPLNAIVGFSEILQNRYFGEMNERQMEYASAIVESSNRLTALIDNILDLATVEAGFFQLDLKQVEAEEVIANLQSLWQERATNRDLTLKIQCDIKTPDLVCDERRISQVLFNLLSNAFKFTTEGGSVELGAERQGGQIVFYVQDNGVGIAAGDQSRVFEKFEQGDATDAAQRSAGAGLGLSLVKSLVELHGGEVHLKSEPGKGTRVACHIPAGLSLNQPEDWESIEG